MKYRPSLPEQNDNVSHEHPLREFFVLLAGLCVIGAIIYVILGLFIDAAVDHISPETEQRWFKKTSINAAIAQMIDEDKKAESFESELFDSLKACANIDYPINLWRVESNAINAVALPGGDIIVFSGLLDKLKSENGLAFVLGHELGHFKHRDHLKGLGRGIVLTVISSALTGSDSSLTALVSPVSMLGQANYSQSRESAADIFALEILNCHYGHVGGATEFFESILNEHKDVWELAHYFSSHPEVEKRIENMSHESNTRGFVDAKTITLTK